MVRYTLPLFLLAGSAAAFAPTTHNKFALSPSALFDAPPATSEPTDSVADIEIPTKLPSAVGKDYVPLATMLATGQLAEADQFTRDALIEISGAKAKGRAFVYWTEVQNIPNEVRNIFMKGDTINPLPTTSVVC